MYKAPNQITSESEISKSNRDSYIPFPYDLNPVFEKSREIVNRIFDKRDYNKEWEIIDKKEKTLSKKGVKNKIYDFA